MCIRDRYQRRVRGRAPCMHAGLTCVGDDVAVVTKLVSGGNGDSAGVKDGDVLELIEAADEITRMQIEADIGYTLDGPYGVPKFEQVVGYLKSVPKRMPCLFKFGCTLRGVSAGLQATVVAAVVSIDKYTVFEIRVSTTEGSWTIYKQFADFKNLDALLGHMFPAGWTSKLPRTRVFSSNKATVVKERLFAIETYLRVVLKNDRIAETAALDQFLCSSHHECPSDRVTNKVNMLFDNSNADDLANAAEPPPYEGDASLQEESVSTSLPPFWAAAMSADGQSYYYNTITNETTWDRPELVECVGPVAAPTPSMAQPRQPSAREPRTGPTRSLQSPAELIQASRGMVAAGLADRQIQRLTDEIAAQWEALQVAKQQAVQEENYLEAAGLKERLTEIKTMQDQRSALKAELAVKRETALKELDGLTQGMHRAIAGGRMTEAEDDAETIKALAIKIELMDRLGVDAFHAH
eukprot:TRINITY_DN3386_c0_g1_i4.p1 TRINITY_DN3386_c0_g1~~TRINITY_DN3386_c0_g1_i4.p1  ORF type:complete len:466 (+),score=107.68 TRINITY_DN3386_c0_g1_i4:108-1505(+)